MISKPLAIGVLAATCVGASAGGAYLAVRQNAAATQATAAADPVPVAAAIPAKDTGPAVAETEAIVTPVTAPTLTEPVETPAPAAPAKIERAVERASRPASRRTVTRPAAREDARAKPEPRTAESPVAQPVDAPVPTPPVEEPRAAAAYETARPEPTPPPAPRFEELVVPSTSVIGLRIDTALSSERAQVEDRVEATVTRDVHADGHVAIPAGTRVRGTVTAVERGGKIKERARLGVRFHTLVLADGSELPIRTETIFREGAAPSAESTKKIGGAAIGGAILGAIMGGGKGAIIGGATGAGAGTAAVMAGDRNAATLTAGTIVNARLSAPVTIQVERQ